MLIWENQSSGIFPDLCNSVKYCYDDTLCQANQHSIFKGTVSVISSDPPCKDNNARFTTVFLKP